MLGTSSLNVKSRTFYNNYGCRTKKMKYHGYNTKVHTKNMDFSNIIISVTCYMTRELYLYFIAVWPSPDLFSQDKKWTSAEIVFISKFLVKTKEVNFSFLTFSRLLMMTFSFLHILNFNNFKWVIATLQTPYMICVRLAQYVCVGITVKNFHHGH